MESLFSFSNAIGLTNKIAFLVGSFVTVTVLRRRYNKHKNTLFVADVDASISKLVQGGPGNLYVIMDFDRTMSVYWDSSRTSRAPSTHGILERGRSSEFKAKAELYTQHYFPLETDPSLSIEDKIPHMIDWYRKVHDLFLAEPFMGRSDVALAVAQSEVTLRPGVLETIAWCDRHSVPMIVMSAGIADVIAEILRQKYSKALPQSLHIISNSMQFDDCDKLVGFTDPVLHMFNKTGLSIPEAIASQLRSRCNAIVVGDSPGDATMADGLGFSTLLKIGLLNDNIAACLKRYSELFDLLLLDDSDLTILVDILKKIAA